VSTTAQKAALPPGNDDPVDTAAIDRRSRRSHELLSGLTAACALVVLLSAFVLAFASAGRGGGAWTLSMAGVLGLAALSRARLFRRSAQVGTLVWGGVGTIAVLMAGAAVHVSALARQTWFFGAVLAGGLILIAVAFALPNRSLSPRWARSIDLLDGLLLASVIPVLLGVLDVYTSVQSVGHH
jgi:hypothetical protein